MGSIESTLKFEGVIAKNVILTLIIARVRR